MDYRVIFKDTFLADLERIVRFIAVHNPSAARKLGDMIIQSSESLRSVFLNLSPSGSCALNVAGYKNTCK